MTDDSFIAACTAILAAHDRAHESDTLWKGWLEASRTLAAEAGRDPAHPTGGPEPAFASFRERWPKNFERAFQQIGLEADADAAYLAFHETLATGIAYPDTVPALEMLAPYFKLAVVSNADEDHLRLALDANAIPIDLVLSSETAASYKPRRPIFRQAADLLGEHIHDILYVGDSPLADLLGARYAGMHTAWINRAAAELPAGIPKPDYEVRTLTELAEKLLAERGE